MAQTIPSNVSNIPETIKLEENTQEKLPDISLDDNLLDLTTKAQPTKAKISRWDYMKLKSFCTAKETSNKMQSNLSNMREYRPTIRLIRGSCPKYIRSLDRSIMKNRQSD